MNEKEKELFSDAKKQNTFMMKATQMASTGRIGAIKFPPMKLLFLNSKRVLNSCLCLAVTDFIFNTQVRSLHQAHHRIQDTTGQEFIQANFPVYPCLAKR